MDPKLAKETSRIWLWEKHLFHIIVGRGTSLIQPPCKSQIAILEVPTLIAIKVCKLGCDEIGSPPFEKEQPLLKGTFRFETQGQEKRRQQKTVKILNFQGFTNCADIRQPKPPLKSRLETHVFFFGYVKTADDGKHYDIILTNVKR